MIDQNPHPPADGDETVTCAGCSQPVSVNDDTMAWDDPDGPDGFYVAHVDCPLPELLEERRLELQYAAELEEERPAIDTGGPNCFECGRPVLSSGELTMARDGNDDIAFHRVCYSASSPGLHCNYHPERPAVVNLDWLEDGCELCADCIVPRVRELWETLTDMFVGEPEIRIRPV